MLVLSRFVGERIFIGDDIIVTVLEVRRNGHVRIGIEAPKDVPVHREEVWQEAYGKQEDRK